MTGRTDTYGSFLAGELPDHVLIYLHDDVIGSTSDLLEVGTRTESGVVLVVPGSEGRSAFQQVTGLDPMNFAGTAMDTDGEIDDDCTGGRCPDGEDGHYVTFVFAFAEEQNEDAGDLYADGDVIHAYAACTCGTKYSEKWVVE